jgi:hypothetical protein
MHVENFGTWRDAQARLVWGVNDFDDAAPMPYAYDLVRLLTSARLAPTLAVNRREAAIAIAEGYQKGLEQPRPMLLDEHEHWLRRLVGGAANASQKFWKEVDCYPRRQTRGAGAPGTGTQSARRRADRALRLARQGRRQLGRPRYLVIGLWQGGRLVQEARASVPSAWHWAHPGSSAKSRVLEWAFGAYRSPDPHLRIKAGYVMRRIAPDAHKVELADVSGQGLGEELLTAMGAELGAIHATRHRTSILKDLRKRNARWLDWAAAAAEKAVRRDFADFRRLG